MGTRVSPVLGLPAIFVYGCSRLKAQRHPISCPGCLNSRCCHVVWQSAQARYCVARLGATCRLRWSSRSRRCSRLFVSTLQSTMICLASWSVPRFCPSPSTFLSRVRVNSLHFLLCLATLSLQHCLRNQPQQRASGLVSRLLLPLLHLPGSKSSPGPSVSGYYVRGNRGPSSVRDSRDARGRRSSARRPRVHAAERAHRAAQPAAPHRSRGQKYPRHSSQVRPALDQLVRQ